MIVVNQVNVGFVLVGIDRKKPMNPIGSAGRVMLEPNLP